MSKQEKTEPLKTGELGKKARKVIQRGRTEMDLQEVLDEQAKQGGVFGKAEEEKKQD